MSAINTGLSGLLAAQTRLNTSASNVANIRSTVGEVDGKLVNKPYQPMDVAQESLAEGGVSAVVLPRQPESVAVYDPNGEFANSEGIVHHPNVDLAEENLNQLLGKTAYLASLKTIEADENTTQSLLDIIS